MSNTSYGNTWTVPSRQIPQEKLERIKDMVIEGHTVDTIAAEFQHTKAYIYDLLRIHFKGIRRLKQQHNIELGLYR